MTMTKNTFFWNKTEPTTSLVFFSLSRSLLYFSQLRYFIFSQCDNNKKVCIFFISGFSHFSDVFSFSWKYMTLYFVGKRALKEKRQQLQYYFLCRGQTQIQAMKQLKLRSTIMD